MTYEITKGQQYDTGGATVLFGHLAAQYKADGTFDAGDFPFGTPTELAAAILRVIATGQPETVGEAGVPEYKPITERATPVCPACGTYCHGDCEAN